MSCVVRMIMIRNKIKIKSISLSVMLRNECLLTVEKEIEFCCLVLKSNKINYLKLGKTEEDQTLRTKNINYRRICFVFQQILLVTATKLCCALKNKLMESFVVNYPVKNTILKLSTMYFSTLNFLRFTRRVKI